MVKRSVIVLLLCGSVAATAAVRVELSRNVIQEGETVVAKFIIDGDSSAQAPDWGGLNNDFQITRQSQQSSYQLINGRQQSQTIFELELLPKRQGQLVIPPIQIGATKSEPAVVTVNKPVPTPQKQGEDFFIDITAEPKNPYVQQEVIYTMKIFMAYQLRGNMSPLRAENTIIEQLGKERNYRVAKFGRNYNVHERRYVIYPQASGLLNIPPFQLTGQFVHGGRWHKMHKNSPSPTLHVRPVPAAFVGNFWLPAKKVVLHQNNWLDASSSWRQGEPLTRKLGVKATGLLATQLPKLDKPDVPGFKVYVEQAALNNHQDAHGFIGELTQDMVFIPSESGDYVLPEITVPWWNVTTDKMEYARLPVTPVSISKAEFGTLVMDEVPEEPKPAHFGRTTQSGKIWIASSFVLGLGWLATLLFIAWRSYLFRKLKNKTQALYASSIRRCHQHLKSACSANDVAAARTALLQWGKAVWPDDAPNTLSQLAARCHDNLCTEIHTLERALYGRDNAWHGERLWQAFLHEPNQPRNDYTSKTDSLEVLHRLR